MSGRRRPPRHGHRNRKNKEEKPEGDGETNENEDANEGEEDKEEKESNQTDGTPNISEKKRPQKEKKPKKPTNYLDSIDISDESSITFVFHPDELSLKGKNRPQFEEILADNIRFLLRHAGVTRLKIQRLQQRFFVTVPLADEQKAYDVAHHVFGVSNFARCYSLPRDLDTLCSRCVEHIRSVLTQRPIESFRVETSRVDKRYPMKSPEISSRVGSVIHETLKIPVNLTKPSFTLHIECLDTAFVFFSERIEGAKGLPIRSSGRIACLLSGGFDSPVMVWMMMRRGCDCTLIHFHAAPFGGWRSSVSKVRKIVSVLREWGGPSKFYAIAIGEQQRQIAEKAPARLRVTLYRRLMVRIAVKIMEKHKCDALATGDSLGQVASQTCESMTTIQEAIAPTLIFRPLLGFTKEEIMRRAQEIGTKQFSELEGGDCCSHMLPKKVATKPSIEDAKTGEENLDIPNMVKAAVDGAQLIDINDPWNDEEDDAQGEACPLFSFEE